MIENSLKFLEQDYHILRHSCEDYGPALFDGLEKKIIKETFNKVSEYIEEIKFDRTKKTVKKVGEFFDENFVETKKTVSDFKGYLKSKFTEH